jgi:ribosomal protein S6
MGRVERAPIDTIRIDVKGAGSVRDRVERYDHYDVALEKLNNVNHLTPGSVTNKVVNYTRKTLELTDSMVRTTSSVMKSVDGFFRESRFVADAVEFLTPILRIAKTIAIALAPFYLYQFGKGIYEFAKHKIDLSDFLLNSFQSTALFTDSIVSFLQDLVTLGKLPLEILKFLWPFDLIGIVLSTISIISHSRGWHRAANFSKEFEKLMDFNKDSSQLTNEEIDAVVNFITKQDKGRIEKVFEVGKTELVSKIEKVANRAKLYNKDSVPTEERMQAQEEFTSAMKSLRGRVKNKIVSHQLGVTTSSISLVANSILFVTPFILPVCPGFAAVLPGLYTLKSVGGAISFSNFLYRTITKYQFNHSDLMKQKTKMVDWGDIELKPLVKDTTASDIQEEKAKSE